MGQLWLLSLMIMDMGKFTSPYLSSRAPSTELTALIEKLQKNADKVQKNIYDVEQNLNKVQSDEAVFKASEICWCWQSPNTQRCCHVEGQVASMEKERLLIVKSHSLDVNAADTYLKCQYLKTWQWNLTISCLSLELLTNANMHECPARLLTLLRTPLLQYLLNVVRCYIDFQNLIYWLYLWEKSSKRWWLKLMLSKNTSKKLCK